MSVSKLSSKIKKTPVHLLARRLDSFIRHNRSYRNLEKDDRKVLLDILKSYKEKKRHGYSITSRQLKRDMYKLHHQRLRLGLSRSDLDDIRTILKSFID